MLGRFFFILENLLQSWRFLQSKFMGVSISLGLGLFWFLCFAGVVNAGLVVHITQGVDKPIPIGFSVISERDNKNLELEFLMDQISSVIDKNLGLTGQFALTHADQFFLYPATTISQLPEIITKSDGSGEGNKAPDYIVLASLKSSESESKSGDKNKTIDFSFQLFNTYTHRALGGRIYQDVPISSWRLLGNEVSNQIYQVITGIPGDFDSKIAYVLVNHPTARNATYKLIVANQDGSSPQVLLSQQNDPIASLVWSPDDKKIAYVSYLNNRMAIYTIDLATGHRVLVSHFEGLNGAPDYSPNESLMAMALSRGEGANTQIYLVNIKTKQYQKLTQNIYASSTEPSFSPDGQSLVFTSNQGGSPQVYQMNLVSQNITRLTYQGVQNFKPEYTPDGKNIVMMHREVADGAINIGVLNIDSGEIKILTQGSLDKSPTVSPNGQRVLYVSQNEQDDNNGERASALNEVSMYHGHVSEIKTPEGWVQSAAWSRE